MNKQQNPAPLPVQGFNLYIHSLFNSPMSAVIKSFIIQSKSKSVTLSIFLSSKACTSALSIPLRPSRYKCFDLFRLSCLPLPCFSFCDFNYNCYDNILCVELC